MTIPKAVIQTGLTWNADNGFFFPVSPGTGLLNKNLTGSYNAVIPSAFGFCEASEDASASLYSGDIQSGSTIPSFSASLLFFAALLQYSLPKKCRGSVLP